VINPDAIVKTYGADALRVYEMFMGPFDQPIPWDTQGLIGVRRFLERVYTVVSKIAKDLKKSKVTLRQAQDDLQKSKLIHSTIKKVSQDIETQDYNTAVSALMIQFNGVDGQPDWRPRIEAMKGHYFCDLDALEKFLIILSPFAPHLAEELWQKFAHKKSIFLQSWPKFDQNLIKPAEIELVAQINGKVRDRILVTADLNQEQAEKIVKASPKVVAYLAGKEIKKVIFVPGRIINFVTST
jgi:leucyl-tRNA synthetase